LIEEKLMAEMTGGQALMKSLYLEGVRVIFGLPGVQLYHAMDALYKEPGIRFITTRHEQATGYMADGYSRAGGEGIGTALMVPGPGLQNASAGIGTAYAASSPMMVVCGQIERDMIGGDRGMLHEVNDQLESIKPVTKWAQRVLNPTDIPEAVHEAFRQLKTGRPRPVEIEVPPETLAELADVELREPEEPKRIQADGERVEQAAKMLTEAKNPLIWVGGGAVSSGASQALVKVAEHLQAGVIATAEGKGAISDKHPLALGALWLRNDNIAKAFDHDVILAVGTRMAAPNLLGGQKIIQIDVDEEELGRNYEDTFSILGDARDTLEQLHGALSAQSSARPDRSSEVADQRAARADASITREPQASLLGAVRAAMPDDGILVAGMTQVGYYSRAYFPVYEPRTFLTSSYSGNLGFAYPTALGAKVAQPDKAVVALSGDGGFLFNSQELATAVQHGINAVVVVFNDNAFGNVMRDQVNRFESRIIGSKLHNPDFVKLAEAYGARGLKASGPEELEATLRDVLAANDAPTLIEVPVGPMPTPFE
jgi:acetolactate synthase-1/2/3 large subunit